jgi:hypothetical protein
MYVHKIFRRYAATSTMALWVAANLLAHCVKALERSTTTTGALLLVDQEGLPATKP